MGSWGLYATGIRLRVGSYLSASLWLRLAAESVGPTMSLTGSRMTRKTPKPRRAREFHAVGSGIEGTSVRSSAVSRPWFRSRTVTGMFFNRSRNSS